MTPLDNALDTLRMEQANLASLLARVNRAIDALTDAPAKKEAATKKRRMSAATKKKRKPMSAATKKAVSDRMKQYWAARKK